MISLGNRKVKKNWSVVNETLVEGLPMSRFP